MYVLCCNPLKNGTFRLHIQTYYKKPLQPHETPFEQKPMNTFSNTSNPVHPTTFENQSPLSDPIRRDKTFYTLT